MAESNPEELIDRNRYDILRNTYQQKNIIPYRGTYFCIDPSVRLDIAGRLRLNTNCFQENGRVTNLRLDTGARLTVNGMFDIFYGGDIICFSGGELELGSGFCNSNLILRCTKKITIGEDAAISHNVTIMDSDAHEILGNRHAKTQPVSIGRHVWIGTGAKILKGVTIGEGAVIAAGAVVTKDVPERCLAAGVPAKVVRKEIQWKI
jgi:acetyltransferase-like isoleucine patch superfamily enzyme